MVDSQGLFHGCPEMEWQEHEECSHYHYHCPITKGTTMRHSFKVKSQNELILNDLEGIKAQAVSVRLGYRVYKLGKLFYYIIVINSSLNYIKDAISHMILVRKVFDEEFKNMGPDPRQ